MDVVLTTDSYTRIVAPVLELKHAPVQKSQKVNEKVLSGPVAVVRPRIVVKSKLMRCGQAVQVGGAF